MVVGDGKTYDHLNLQREYGSELNWLAPFPGDWHTIKALQPILMRLCWDISLKQLARAMGYRGEALSSLVKCGDFRKYRISLLARYQVITIALNNASNMFSNDISKLDEVWQFWEVFYTRDIKMYISLWVAIRSHKWELRAAALK